jgi:hypothetical protein
MGMKIRRATFHSRTKFSFLEARGFCVEVFGFHKAFRITRWSERFLPAKELDKALGA